MKEKLSLYLPLALLTYLIYAFLHEAGHAIFMILYGSQITDFSFILSPHVSGSSLAISTSFTESVTSAGGPMLPVLVSFIALICYRKEKHSLKYHILHTMYTVCILGSTSVWIFMPLFIIPERLNQYSGDDIEKFIYNSQIPPAVVSLGAVFITGLLLILAWKKGILSKYKELYLSK